MPDRTGLPPRNESAVPPPPGGSDTSAQLRRDIESGRTGDKVAAFDPAAAMLGTDAEAAGHPPAGDAVAAARHYERGMSAPAAPARSWWPSLVMATLVVVLAVWMFLP